MPPRVPPPRKRGGSALSNREDFWRKGPPKAARLRQNTQASSGQNTWNRSSGDSKRGRPRVWVAKHGHPWLGREAGRQGERLGQATSWHSLTARPLGIQSQRPGGGCGWPDCPEDQKWATTGPTGRHQARESVPRSCALLLLLSCAPHPHLFRGAPVADLEAGRLRGEVGSGNGW